MNYSCTELYRGPMYALLRGLLSGLDEYYCYFYSICAAITLLWCYIYSSRTTPATTSTLSTAPAAPAAPTAPTTS